MTSTRSTPIPSVRPRPVPGGADPASDVAVVRRPIDSGWELRARRGPVPAELVGRAVPATLPGCVHTDLLAAGLIEPPELDDTAAGQDWIGRTDWTYRTGLDLDDLRPGTRAELVFDGLDTVSTVLFDGEPLGETANQSRRYRFDVTGSATAG